MLDSRQIQELESRYLNDFSRFETIAQQATVAARDVCAQYGTACSVKGRVKELASFTKKALQDKYTDPYTQIQDKIGVRIICDFPQLIGVIVDDLSKHFVVHEREHKSALVAGDVDRFGYEGVHCIVSLREVDDLKSNDASFDWDQQVLEIQLQTRAQNLWNDVSHQFLYKPSSDVTSNMKRRLFRLVALMEIFDQEIRDVKEYVDTQPTSGMDGLIRYLATIFGEFTSADYNRDLTNEIVRKVAVDDGQAEALSFLLRAFVENNRSTLLDFFEKSKGSTGSAVLTSQPEAMLLLSELQRDPFALADRWAQWYPEELLQSVGTRFGERVPDRNQ